MKYSSVILLSSAVLCEAWSVNRRNALTSLVGGAAALIAVQPVNAAEFAGSYSDPGHPNCKRNIVVNGDSINLSGTDGNPGCPANGDGREWGLSGKVSGDDIFVDFSPKGGPKDLKGVWDGSGIRWPDGNKWTKKE